MQINDKVNRECEACTKAKMHRIPIPRKSTNKSSRPLEIIHTDLCSRMNVESLAGSRYHQTFTDDHTRYTQGPVQ